MPDSFDFRGRILQVWLKGPAQGCVLQHVSIQRIGERSFLAGELCEKLDGSIDPRMGCRFWLALDEIEMICEYPDLKTAQLAYAARQRQT